jgi:outer membrane protein TolC
MRISPNWMTLSVSLAILAQALPTYAQTSELQPEPLSDISQVSDISQAELTKELPTALSSVQSEALFPTLASESNAPMQLLTGNSKAPIPKQIQAQVKSSPDRSVNGKKESAIAALRLIQLKEMRLSVNRPVTLLALEPDITLSANSTASVSIEKEPSQSLPGKTVTDKKDEKKDTKIAIGLDPIAPLTVPTTPSQVKIERNQGVKLEEALALATSNNRDIALARIAVDRARAVLQEAEAAKLPTVNAQGSYTFSDSAQTRLSNISANPLFAPNSTTSQPVSGTIGVNYNVFTSGLVDANIRTAENQLRIAEADLNRISQAVRITIATAYYTLQNSDATVLIRQKSVENRERSLQDTSALEKAGVGTKFDVLQSQVQLSNAQQSLLDAQANQLVARRDLARILVYPPNVDITAADPIEPAPDWKLSLEESILLAYKNRSELDIQKLQREVARDRARAALARVGPQVGLFTNFNIADNFNQVGGAALGYSVGVNFSMSLFDGGVANAQFNQFKADQATAEVQFDKAGDQSRFDVEQAYINIQSRRTQISTTAQAVEQSNEALRLARLRLSAGVGTQLEVIRAEEDLTQAQVNRLQAIIGFNQSLANLQRAINGL